MTEFVPQREPPYTERYVRWCGKTGVSHPLLPDWRAQSRALLFKLYELRRGNSSAFERMATANTAEIIDALGIVSFGTDAVGIFPDSTDAV
ncbi:hypothetical protein AN477_12265 [Alicyclobacillus ferrooxydans]|uniref:Uncharacterized protein n=1 Tax=Alicyclobacillus ferrooxydans TaxID=471514 RepID=A0A0P9EWH8_9BACL|nr:hypothetical protein AN477_12265 [Alicyclobacillus ferrooxydans]